MHPSLGPLETREQESSQMLSPGVTKQDGGGKNAEREWQMGNIQLCFLLILHPSGHASSGSFLPLLSMLTYEIRRLWSWKLLSSRSVLSPGVSHQFHHHPMAEMFRFGDSGFELLLELYTHIPLPMGRFCRRFQPSVSEMELLSSS